MANGVTHEVVEDDQAGVASILKWLSFVPRQNDATAACRECADPIDRVVEFCPTPVPYDLEDDFVRRLKLADSSLDTKTATVSLRSMFSGDWEDNKSVINFFKSDASAIKEKITDMKKSALLSKIDALQKDLQSL